MVRELYNLKAKRKGKWITGIFKACLNIAFKFISTFFVEKFPKEQTFHHIFKTWSLCFILMICSIHSQAPCQWVWKGGRNGSFFEMAIVCGSISGLPVSLIIAEHGVVFDSVDTLTARRLAKAPRMTAGRSEEMGWKAGVQLREHQKRRNFNHSHCVRAHSLR